MLHPSTRFQRAALRTVHMTSVKLALGLVLLSLLSCQHTGLRGPSAIDINSEASPLFVCSFNVQFLGSFKDRNNEALSRILEREGCDLVAIQELVAPPDLTALPASPYFKSTEPVTYPSGLPLKPSARSTDFFINMHRSGFDGFILSPEDTGRSLKNNTNSTGTEWWVVFYKTSKVEIASDLPHGFLSEKVTANPHWERVPYAFGFRTLDKGFDFVLISVHLKPDKDLASRNRRKHELEHIQKWVEEMEEKNSERDYIILGDMNIYSAAELKAATPKGFISLNTEAKFNTNTNLKGQLPYDHVMVRPEHTPEAPLEDNFIVMDLLALAKEFWVKKTSYPGDASGYHHDTFRTHFSDHHPVGFYLYPSLEDDD